MPVTCRVLPHEVGRGASNMALDHALLDAVDADPCEAIFRTYAWSEPTLSLGYFQHIADARSEPRWDGVPIVRRPSGGGALWHDHELTYMLVVPRSHPLAMKPSALYRAVHAAIAQMLRAGEIAADRRGEDRTGAGARPFLCFLDRDPEDVLLSGAKVVGSAQRRRPGAVLQHGSLLLRRSAATPELPGLSDLSMSASGGVDWAARLGIVIPSTLGLDPKPGRVSECEAARARSLAVEVYGCETWTERR